MNTIRHLVPVCCAVGALSAIESSAVPANPAVDTYTKITTDGQLGGGHPFMSDTQLDGPITTTHHANSDEQYTSPGSLDGEGTGDFGTLQSKVRIAGPAALHGYSGSTFNDHWTVTSPSIPNGTIGTMQLSFNLSGHVTVLDTVGNPVASNAYSSVGLIVFLNPTTTSNGTTLLQSFINLDPGQTQVQGTQGSPTVTIPFDFVYGSQFGIQTTLRANASTDNQHLYTSSNPYFEHYGGGTIDDVTVDFTNTAELAAIVIPGDPDAQLTASSLADFSSVITTELPPAQIPGDLDGDGFVGITDLNIVLGNWNQTIPPGDPLADPSGDGFVGIEDLNTVLGNWNAGTPPPSAVPEPGSLSLLALAGLAVRRRPAG